MQFGIGLSTLVVGGQVNDNGFVKEGDLGDLSKGLVKRFGWIAAKMESSVAIRDKQFREANR